MNINKMQKDKSRFFVAQAVPEIYEKNEMLKNRGDVFFCYALYMLSQSRLSLLQSFLVTPKTQPLTLKIRAKVLQTLFVWFLYCKTDNKGRKVFLISECR